MSQNRPQTKMIWIEVDGVDKKQPSVTFNDENTEEISKEIWYRGVAVVELDGIEYDVPYCFYTEWEEAMEQGKDYFAKIFKDKVFCEKQGKITPETVGAIEALMRAEFRKK